LRARRVGFGRRAVEEGRARLRGQLVAVPHERGARRGDVSSLKTGASEGRVCYREASRDKRIDNLSGRHIESALAPSLPSAPTPEGEPIMLSAFLLQANTVASTTQAHTRLGGPVAGYWPVMVFFAVAVIFPVLPVVLGRFVRPMLYGKAKMR